MKNKLKKARFEVPPVRPRPLESITPKLDCKIRSMATKFYLRLHRSLNEEFREDWTEAEFAARAWKDNARYAMQIVERKRMSYDDLL